MNISIGMYDYGARHYDASLGRFIVLDRLSEDYYFQSPYVYAANNPIIYIDKNGDGPILGIFGALAGAAVEAGSQVVGAMVTGSSFSEAVSDIDYADVGIAAVEYGLAGLTNGASLIVTSQVSEVLQASVDIYSDGRVETIVGGLNGGETKSLTQATTEYVVGKTIGNLGKKAGGVIDGSLSKSVKSSKSNLTSKTKSLNKSNNVTGNSNTRSKAKSSNQAFKEFSNAKDTHLGYKAVQGSRNSTAGKGTKKLSTAAVGGTTKKVSAEQEKK